MKIEKKTVLITGANRGVGRALLEEALRRGAKRVYAGTRGDLPHADARVVPLTLDVTNASQIQRAADEVKVLDILINNAAVAMPDDLSHADAIQQHLDVNVLGPFHVTHAFLPMLKRAQGAIVNVLSLAALAPVPVIASYSLSKAAALSMTQSMRASLSGQGVTVHGVFLGPVDTDMTRGFEMAKATPEAAARGILDGLENDEEDIFPDPASRMVTARWRSGVVKDLEREYAAFAPGGAQ